MKGTVLRKSVHPYVKVIPDEGLRLIKKTSMEQWEKYGSANL